MPTATYSRASSALALVLDRPFAAAMSWRAPDGVTPIDITGFTLSARLSWARGGRSNALTTTVDNAAQGQFTVSLDAEDQPDDLDASCETWLKLTITDTAGDTSDFDVPVTVYEGAT